MEQGENGGKRRKRFLAEVADGAAVVAAPEVKKQLKNPLQVQILEDAYAVTSKPSASMKEDLARKTGLDYKQVQRWFENKRYLNKHGPRKCRTRFVSDEILDDQRYGGHGKMSFESGVNFNCISIVSPSDGASLIPSLEGREASFSWRNSQQKSPEPIEPQLHQSPVISQLLLSPKMMQPHPFTLSFEEMQRENLAKPEQTSSSKSAPCRKPRNLAKPGAGTSYIAEGTLENQDFTVTGSCEVKNYCNVNIGNQSTSNRSIGLTSWHADEDFFVRPRKGSRSNHFSDHNNTRTLIAEWKENKKKAVYFVVDNEINSSDSSGTNSTHSERFKHHETVDVVCSTSGLNNYDNKGSDAGKNLNGNKGMPSGYSNEYNGQEIYKNCKDEG